MKHLVFGDMHGKGTGDLDSIIESEDFDSFICLGDFDQTKVIRSVINLEQKFKEKGKSSIVVPGNHDHAIYHNEHIYSGTLEKQGKSIQDLHLELQEDNKSKQYLSNLLNKNHGVETKIGDYSTYVIHGGLGGSLISYYNCPKEIEDLWFRVDFGDYDYRKNFYKMEEKNYNILLRGHDHNRMYGFELGGSYPESLFVTEGGTFELADSKRHMITPGAWVDGNYLIINDSNEKLSLDFRNINN
jgi:predicted phosphodiesterase